MLEFHKALVYKVRNNKNAFTITFHRILLYRYIIHP